MAEEDTATAQEHTATKRKMHNASPQEPARRRDGSWASRIPAHVKVDVQ
uniref:Uncharacterized protein n=1 Tax=Peronospora matthiolae TaxID=2874970 RepID=A0AAV1U3H8_9STRA